MKKILAVFILVVCLRNMYLRAEVIDHRCARLERIPESWMIKAKRELHIAYGHTSHGSQLTSGMSGLVNFKGRLYFFNHGGKGGALDLQENIPGARDLGNPNRTAWANATRSYLLSHPEINVVIWSWCGQVSNASASDINAYLGLMSRLEREHPDVRFVYMTGHLDGSGVKGNLHQRNEQIRHYCRVNNKWLYDFADIESYNPDGKYFLDKLANDACAYDSDGNGSRDANWAIAWQNSHPVQVEWYPCSSAHSQPLNANLKAYAAWWLWARLAGWPGPNEH